MSNQVLKHIVNRKSELAFEPKLLSQEQINSLFEAARWAASSYNEQPWQFYYVSRDNWEQYSKALNTLAEGNKEWAINASMLIFSVANTVLAKTGKPNGYALHDTGMATANLMIQADALGLASHPMGGFDRDLVKAMLGIADDLKPVAAIAIGFSGNTDSLSESNRKRALAPRQRKGINEIAIGIK
ncbi:nitroreductase family protein [Perlabentimonas gracilis]|uniref:nitroreductase family protein n=1 Tax=Perlabentimonas gracilis TaxID=2715279 RepID=UPI00140E7136|nr:nitroreductase family protein [Perlabentimonas gracilis]NHB67101.1 nitroreductase [Perlabentimonas gracilis]